MRDRARKFYARAGVPLVLWNVPFGNTVMATCNNTRDHYMDNQVEYFLEDYPQNTHIAEWASSGVVGMIFGVGGAAGYTTPFDNMKDGVTDPPPVPQEPGVKRRRGPTTTEAISEPARPPTTRPARSS